jgi:glucuronosyltransferase
MPESVKEIFIRVFARIPQRVFWKWETGTSDSTEISTNVKMVDWLPQQAW